MINLIKNGNRFDFESELLWDKVNELKDYIKEKDIFLVGDLFDISTTRNGTSYSRNVDTDRGYIFGFNDLKNGADEIRLILKDIHNCLEKQDSTDIDIFFLRQGIVILLSTDKKIDSALFYKSHTTEYFDKKGYRALKDHFKSGDLFMPLMIALEFDYVLFEKNIYKWEINHSYEEIREILEDCIGSKNVNYTYDDIKTEEEIKAEQKARAELKRQEQEQKILAEQEKRQKEIQQLAEQFEQTKKQMMLLMGQYMAYQQQQQDYDDDDEYDEEFEDDDEFEEFED